MIIFLRFVVIAIGCGASAAVLADDDNKATNPYLVKDNALFFGALGRRVKGMSLLSGAALMPAPSGLMT